MSTMKQYIPVPVDWLVSSLGESVPSPFHSLSFPSRSYLVLLGDRHQVKLGLGPDNVLRMRSALWLNLSKRGSVRTRNVLEKDSHFYVLAQGESSMYSRRWDLITPNLDVLGGAPVRGPVPHDPWDTWLGTFVPTNGRLDRYLKGVEQASTLMRSAMNDIGVAEWRSNFGWDSEHDHRNDLLHHQGRLGLG